MFESRLGVRTKPSTFRGSVKHRIGRWRIKTKELETRLPHRRFERTFVPGVPSFLEPPTPADEKLAALPRLAARPRLTSGAMRLTLALAILVLAACQPSRGSELAPAQCGPSVPETAEHPIAMKASALAGDYDLIQVQSQPNSGTTTSGRLHLTPLDSVAKAGSAGGAVRDLIGWLELSSGDSSWRAAVASRDPRSPGAVLAGQHLRLGPAGSLEGGAQNLQITAVAPEGFWGWWRADRGFAITESPGRRTVPDPAGYFCALRLNR